MWGWVKSAFQYLSILAGKVLGLKAEQQVVGTCMDNAQAAVQSLTGTLINDAISVGEWEAGMRSILKTEYIQQYILGKGGVGQLTQADYGSIGGMLKEQYGYLHKFADEIAAGDLKPGQIQMRANMYAQSANEAWNRARGRAYGIPEGSLPAYPGDGSSQCLTNDLCFWRFEQVDDGWNCYWTLEPGAKHCDDCLARSEDWNPYFISGAKNANE